MEGCELQSLPGGLVTRAHFGDQVVQVPYQLLCDLISLPDLHLQLTHSVQAQHCSLMGQGCSRDNAYTYLMVLLDLSQTLRWFSPHFIQITAQSSLKIILSLFSMSTACFIFLCRTFPHLLIMYLFIVLAPQEHEHYKTRDFDCSI